MSPSDAGTTQQQKNDEDLLALPEDLVLDDLDLGESANGKDGAAMDVDSDAHEEVLDWEDNDPSDETGDPKQRERLASPRGPSRETSPASSASGGTEPMQRCAQPSRGGGSASKVPSNARMMGKWLRPTQLQGADKIEEANLRTQLKGAKWFLNENVGAPECSGDEDAEDDDEAPYCDPCGAYFKHVAKDFVNGDGSLAAVLRLRTLYDGAEVRLALDAIRAENEELKINLAVSVRSEAKANEELAALRKKDVESNVLVERNTWLENQVRNESERARKRHRGSTAPTESSFASDDGQVDHSQRDEEMGDATTQPPTQPAYNSPTVMAPPPLEQKPISVRERERIEDAQARMRLPKLQFPGQPPLPYIKRQGILVSVDAFVMERPPDSWIEHVVDKRGFPMDASTWHTTFALQTKEQRWVYAFRHLYLWQTAVDHYFVPEWVANLLSALAKQPKKNDAAIVRYRDITRNEIGYNPMLLATLMQYREHTTRGCPFVDCWTLDMHLVRGLNLYDLIATPRERVPNAIRPRRVSVELALMEVLISPGEYKRIVENNNLTIAAKLQISVWRPADDTEINVETMSAALAEMGVSIEMVDDAFMYARTWLREFVQLGKDTQGWTLDRANNFLNAAFAGGVPPGMHSPEHDFFLCHPALPWQQRPDNTIQYAISDWRHPEMRDLRREAGSAIQEMLDSGRNLRDAPRNLNRVVENSNPFTKAQRSQPHPAAPVLPPAPTITADFISGPTTAVEPDPAATMSNPTAKPKRKPKNRRGLPPAGALHGPQRPYSSFAQSQHPFTFNSPMNGHGTTPQFTQQAGYMSEPDIQHYMSTAPFMGVSAASAGPSHTTSQYPPPTYSAVPQTTAHYAADLESNGGYDMDYYPGETNSYGGMHI
ncbi:hypothetical protein DFH09DRAFT_1075496 [Mycena vulgaris]|nr:hypothetical protein DFH09DRAFT_1075496 [Mycena vulgaris]